MADIVIPPPTAPTGTYVPRTPPAWDFSLGDLTVDDGWHDLDLSLIVPVGAFGIVINSGIVADATGKYLYVSENPGNLYSALTSYSQKENVYSFNNGIVRCPANRIIKYRANNAVSITQLRIAVLGWFI